MSPNAPRTSWTADELARESFPPLRWAVPTLLPEGCGVLAGAPKIGKSWLALDLAVSVAGGGQALGSIDTGPPGPVLYLALEDTPRRLQDRQRVVLRGAAAPRLLTISVDCPPLPDGGHDRIVKWLDSHPGARMVIIDVWARVRGALPRGTNPYYVDYAAVAQIRALAARYQVAVVVVHHDRKAQATDFVDNISGSKGVAGAADYLMVLHRARGGGRATLEVTGRDLPEQTHHLVLDSRGIWSLRHPPAGPAPTDIAPSWRAILTAVRAHPGQGPKALAETTGLAYTTVRGVLRRMDRAGLVTTGGRRGHYIPVTPETAGTTPGQHARAGVTGDPTRHGEQH